MIFLFGGVGSGSDTPCTRVQGSSLEAFFNHRGLVRSQKNFRYFAVRRY